MLRPPIHVLALLLIGLALLTACAKTLERTLTRPEQLGSLDPEAQFLKAHMRDGRVYVLSEWTVDGQRSVFGRGALLDVHRQVVRRDTVTIPLDSVALFETNQVHTSSAVAALAVVTTASLALTAYCAANPKACFGSCPTFYLSDGERPLLQAEGFSGSIAPSLEARDIDALYRVRPVSRDLEVRMTNEALETHVVRHVDVLAAPRPGGGRVFATADGEFWEAHAVTEPAICLAPEGDCRPALRAFDGVERYSVSDSTDLASRETIELAFSAAPPGELGLVIASRQSLLSTYVFYQALAYLGRSAGQWLAALERGDAQARARAGGLSRLLGGIEVQVRDPLDAWVTVGATQETGPLATDVRLIPLPHSRDDSLKVRLRLARGNWRLDYVALVQLGARVEPLRLRPSLVRRGSVVDEHARALLLDSGRVLTTLPGDEYTLVYTLPEDFGRYELFLDSQGYYLEWMRSEWLAEEDPARAAMLFLAPEVALRAMAPEFKRREAEMERTFWSSRYVSR